MLIHDKQNALDVLRQYYVENILGTGSQDSQRTTMAGMHRIESFADSNSVVKDMASECGQPQQNDMTALISENRALLEQTKKASEAVRRLEQERLQLEQSSAEESDALHSEVCVRKNCWDSYKKSYV